MARFIIDENLSIAEGLIHTVERRAKRLRLLSNLIFAFFVTELVFAFLGLTRSLDPIWAFQVLLAASLCTVTAVFFFERTRRTGEQMFERISDLLQSARRTFNPDSPQYSSRLRNVQSSLRDFVRASDLLLFPGKLGPGLYFLVAIFLTFFVLFYFRF